MRAGGAAGWLLALTALPSQAQVEAIPRPAPPGTSTVGAGAAASPAPQSGKATSDWSITLGGGGAVRPVYPGSKDVEFTPVPVVSIVYKDLVFLGSDGLGVNAYKNEWLTLGASVFFRGGRDEDDADRLRGMGDIDFAVQGRLFAKVKAGPVNLGATLARDFGGSDGFTADLTASSTFKLSDSIRLTPGITTTIGDDNYMETWFGVSPLQAQRSGLSTHDAGAGIRSVGAFLAANYRLTEHWSINSAVRLDYLVGDAADSPITERRAQPTFMLTGSYRF